MFIIQFPKKKPQVNFQITITTQIHGGRFSPIPNAHNSG
jgi:hypothetical protein